MMRLRICVFKAVFERSFYTILDWDGLVKQYQCYQRMNECIRMFLRLTFGSALGFEGLRIGVMMVMMMMVMVMIVTLDHDASQTRFA